MVWELRVEPAANVLGKWVHKNIDALLEQEWEPFAAFYDAKHGQTYILLKKQTKT